MLIDISRFAVLIRKVMFKGATFGDVSLPPG
jgi:hypothetical protein